MELVTLSGGIAPLVLLAAGIVLIALESILFSFILLWIGVAFIIVSGITYAYIDIDLKWQISIISIVSLILLFALRSKFLKIFLKAKGKEHEDNFLSESGYGVIKNQKVYYKATYWDINPADENSYEDEQKVFVQKTEKNIAYISSQKSAEIK